METKRPRLDDPEEFAIIRKMYFDDTRPYEDIDPIEKLERIEARQRNKNKSSR